MEEIYRSDLKARVTSDSRKGVRAILHSQEYWPSDQPSAMGTAISYLQEMASVYGIPAAQLANLHQKVEYLNPMAQEVEYRLSDDNTCFDSTTLGFCQTCDNTPVWQAGLKVTVKHGPNRVIRSVNTNHAGIEVRMPARAKIERLKKLFTRTETLRRRAGEAPGESEDTEAAALVRSILEPEAAGKRAAGHVSERVRFIRGRFWIYRYDEQERFHTSGRPVIERHNRGLKPGPGAGRQQEPDDHHQPALPIKPVHKKLEDGEYYFVAEITFAIANPEDQELVWRALIELDTGSVLYLRALVGNLNGLVFDQDPITATGDVTLDHSSTDATLNPVRDDLALQGLDAPAAGSQALSGSYSRVMQVEGEPVTPPTQPPGTDFDYDTRTNDFAAVSAYFHVDRVFRYIADLGFDVKTYFKDTSFPVPTDHRCFGGSSMNAHCIGNGLGGIEHVGYGLLSTKQTPLGLACDPRVHWHEVCGHGILFQYVDLANFGFAHSAGDGISAIYFDPDSKCWGVDGTALGKPGDLRFAYLPWNPGIHRRFDREVSKGWAWGGVHDNSDDKSEQILATTLFRIYRSIGGDSANLAHRRFASRMMLYLILRAVGKLTKFSNPSYARDFAVELIDADLDNWTSDGIYGGAYNKVIRWAFEKQGEYQTPLIENGDPGDGHVATPGDPPDVDVYIDDGRAGEYGYQAVHWQTTAIWNRHAADGQPGHQEPILYADNYAYVKIKNRGTQVANNVVVRGFHSEPGAGLLWPGDFAPLTPPQISAGSLGANNSEEKTVGPFTWTPGKNTYGHDCMLMVVSADDDPSNVDNFTVGEVIPDWRLVPNDNNVAQRNVLPTPGAGGSGGLMAGLDGVSMWIGNPNPRRASMELKVDLPDLLESSGWRLAFEGIRGNRFELQSGQKQEVVLRLQPGADFARDQVEQIAARDIQVAVLADGIPIGGMTYRLDPAIKRPINAAAEDRDCTGKAQALLDCLGVRGRDVKKAAIKEIVIGMKLRDEDRRG